MKIFNLPDLGEGLPDAEIVRWHVQEGDSVKLDQILVSVETAKAVVEVPSPIEGIIQKLFGKAGDLVHTGAPLVEFDLAEQNKGQAAGGHSTTQTKENNNEPDRRNNAATAAGELQIGNTVIQEQTPLQKQNFAGRATQVNPSNSSSPLNPSNLSNPFNNPLNKATPAIRALAQQLQIDLSTVTGTGPNGAITKSDLEKAQASGSASTSSSSQSSLPSQSSLSGLSAQELAEFVPLQGVRRAMAHNMAKSHASIVPITVMDDAKLLNWSEKEDVTVRMIQAIIEGIKKEPDINAWFDPQTMSRRVIKELHLGIAVDTAEGLFVAVIHNADKLNKTELRAELDKLKKKVLDRTISPQDLKGATFTLSNVGVFAGRYANPVVVPPTVAILASGKIREEVVAVKGEVRISKVLPLALTFDHRAVTGGEATRFLAAMLQSLEA